jgi:aminopeptidase C
MYNLYYIIVYRFGCDVGKHFARQIGVLELNSLDWDLGFGVTFEQDKANRLRYGESAMTHAMMFTGVHLDSEGRSQRWRVENSWGEDNGDKGFLSMSDKWFSEFTYQVRIIMMNNHICNRIDTDGVTYIGLLPPLPLLNRLFWKSRMYQTRY